MRDVNRNTFQEVLKNEGVSVIKVYASWCGPCKLLRSRMDKWKEEFSADDVHFYEFDRDTDKEFAVKILKIEALPTILFFKNGEEVNRLRGLTSRVKFMEMLDKSLAL